MERREIKDANIPNATKPVEQIKEQLKKNHLVSTLTKLGTELLEKTEKPTTITVEEFLPFIPLFNMDVERYEKEQFQRPPSYTDDIHQLFKRWKHELGVNLYHPVIIVKSREDPQEVCVLPRMFTRIRADTVDGPSARNNVPAAIARNASTTRDQMILNASLHDLGEANKASDQLTYFRNVKVESALIEKAFVERNMSPDKRAIAMGETADRKDASPIPSSSTSNTMIDDDDD